MNTNTFNDLKQTLTSELEKAEQQHTKTKKEIVQESLDNIIRTGKLDIMNEDEIKLLLSYRLWKQSPNVATGIFHFKK